MEPRGPPRGFSFGAGRLTRRPRLTRLPRPESLYYPFSVSEVRDAQDDRGAVRRPAPPRERGHRRGVRPAVDRRVPAGVDLPEEAAVGPGAVARRPRADAGPAGVSELRTAGARAAR